VFNKYVPTICLDGEQADMKIIKNIGNVFFIIVEDMKKVGGVINWKVTLLQIVGDAEV